MSESITIEEFHKRDNDRIDRIKDILMEAVVDQEALFELHPNYGAACDCGSDHDENKHLAHKHLAHKGILTEFLVMVAYTSYDDDGDQNTCYALIQDNDRPEYAKLGLVEKINRLFL